MSAFVSEGEILRYNLTSRTFDTFVLPEQLSLPVGLAVDNNGNLWATDHGTSIFYTLDTKSHDVTMFATSNASPLIYGLNESSSLPEMRILSHTGWKKELTMDRYGSMSIRVTR